MSNGVFPYVNHKPLHIVTYRTETSKLRGPDREHPKILRNAVYILTNIYGSQGSYTNKTNPVALARKRAIQTERPPLVGEVSVNFSGQRLSRGQRNGSPQTYSRFSRPEPLLFLPSSSSIVLTRLSGPRSRPTTKAPKARCKCCGRVFGCDLNPRVHF
jgi:hypothetical protein